MFNYLKDLIEQLSGSEKVAATFGSVVGYFGGLTLLNVPVFTLEFAGKFLGALLLSAGGAASGVAGKKGATYLFDWWAKRKKKKR